MNYAALDRAMHTITPVLPVPLHGEFTPMATPGHRFLVASNGLFMELKRSWLHAIWPIAADTDVAKPFGALTKHVTLEFGVIPAWIKDTLAKEAAAAGNIEIAAWVIWNSLTRSLEYRSCGTIEASSAKINYERPRLLDHESLVIDLHSHGFGPAFFSSTDNEDDKDEVKISGVIGNVNGVPTWKFRLCLSGIFVKIPNP